MKNFKLSTKTAIVGYTMLCLVLFSSCSGHIVVWNMKDIIGISILGLIIVVVAILFLIAWVQDKINAWKRKRKKN
jgi:small-conductance mechanosensitive channel